MTTNFSFWVNCPFKVAISARSLKYNSITEIGCKNRSVFWLVTVTNTRKLSLCHMVDFIAESCLCG